ncbi:hypothetical protein M0R45_016731 [Rubus argutus]|uniref:Uncharacterized protein n=1 Tax=Rubus argutus TaxID=59490 RepID=A0AAW1XUE5_RUBAR
MAKSRTSGKKNNSIVNTLKFVLEKLLRSLLLGRKSNSDFGGDSTYVPQDVKEGHFAVIAADGGQMKRFVVALSYLSHPRFLDLLKQAAEEYGFDREGALTIPCPPSDLEKILHDKQWQQEEEDSLI